MVERVDINRVLIEMRALKAQAQARHVELPSLTDKPLEKIDNKTVPDFGQVLKAAVDGVNSKQMYATQLATAYEKGDPGVDLPQVMIAAQKASVSFEAMKQVRNKLVAAYQEIMNMPV